MANTLCVTDIEEKQSIFQIDRLGSGTTRKAGEKAVPAKTVKEEQVKAKVQAKTQAEEKECSNPEFELLRYIVLSFLSEASKIVILAVLFHSQIPLFLFVLGMMVLMRKSTGGMHCKRYLACFMVSLIYMFLCIVLLPKIPLPKFLMLLGLLVCICVNYKIGLVVSKYHQKPDEVRKRKAGIRSFIVIFFYMAVMFILPENIYMCGGFWVIVLHTLQLFLAHVNLKGEFLDEKGIKWFKTYCYGHKAA